MTTTLGTQNPEITQHTLVFRAADQSVEPLIGRVVGLGDDAVMVAWGDARHLADSEALDQAQVVELSDLTAWTRSVPERRGYVAGLRAIADALEADPDMPVPYTGNTTSLLVFCDTKEQVLTWTRLMQGRVDKGVDADGGYGFHVEGHVYGTQIKAFVHRDQVCERIVTGTREVTKDVPDPDALAAVPTITVTETVEDVEWVCTPLLAPAPVSA